VRLRAAGRSRRGPGPCVRCEARLEVGQRRRRGVRGLGAAGEDRDRAAVDRACGERAADGKGNVLGAVFAAEQQNLDHLPCGVRAPVAGGERRPQLVEAGGPGATAALLLKRERVLHAAGPALEQLEVVVKLGARAKAAVQALVDRDHLAAVVDRDLPGADARTDPQPGEGDRDRVAVLADGDQRLLIHPWCRRLARVERLRRQREQQRALRGPRLTDRPRAPVDPPAEILLAAGEQHLVELGEVREARDRDQVVAAMAANLALDTTLLMSSLDPRRRELRLEEVVRAQRDEPVALDAPAALEDLLDRRRQVVEVPCPTRLCGRRQRPARDHGGRRPRGVVAGHITVRATRASSAAIRRSARLG
jgi:hypothetical protein